MHESFGDSSHCVVNNTTIKPITVAVKHSLHFQQYKTQLHGHIWAFNKPSSGCVQESKK